MRDVRNGRVVLSLPGASQPIWRPGGALVVQEGTETSVYAVWDVDSEHEILRAKSGGLRTWYALEGGILRVWRVE